MREFFAHPGAVSSDSGGVLDSLETAVGQKDVVRSGGVVTLALLGVAEVLAAGRIVHFVGEFVVGGFLGHIYFFIKKRMSRLRLNALILSNTKFAKKNILYN